MATYVQEIVQSIATVALDSNNQGQVPDGSPLPSVIYPRDPDYYFSDGGTIFLVDGVLFRLPASLLANIEPTGRKAIWFSTTYAQLMEGNAVILLELLPNMPSDRPGASDTNPIVVPNLKAQDFRILLFALLGRPGNKDYMKLFTDAGSPPEISLRFFMHHLNLMTTGLRFDFFDLAQWAATQLDVSLDSSKQLIGELSGATWNTAALQNLWLAGYVGPASLDVLFLLVFGSSLLLDQPLDSALHDNIETCVAFYKNRVGWPTDESNRVLGATLPFILALGPNSSIWKNQLTQDERFDLYVAYAHLVALENCPNLELGWISDPSVFDSFRQACVHCSSSIVDAWRHSFGSIGSFNSLVPLEDIRKLVSLPQCRQNFMNQSNLSCSKNCMKNVVLSGDATLSNLLRCQMYAAYRAVLP